MKKSRYKTLLIISIFGLLGFIVSLSSGDIAQILFYLAMFIVFLILYFKIKKAPAPEPSTTETLSFNHVSQDFIHTTSPDVSVEDLEPLEKIDISGIASTEPIVKSSVKSSTIKSSYKRETHHIAGTSFHQAEIKSMGQENPEYDSTKKELIDNMQEDEKIYRYDFFPSKIELIEEPTNPHDPNAVKVVIDGVHVGYIKKGSCSRIKKLIHSNKIKNISADIHGGAYKMLYSDYDYNKYEDVYKIEKGTTDYFVSITLTLNES